MATGLARGHFFSDRVTAPIRYYASIYRNEQNKRVTRVNALTAPRSDVVGAIRENPHMRTKYRAQQLRIQVSIALLCTPPVVSVRCEILLAHPKKRSEKDERFVEQGGHHMGLRKVVADVAS